MRWQKSKVDQDKTTKTRHRTKDIRKSIHQEATTRKNNAQTKIQRQTSKGQKRKDRHERTQIMGHKWKAKSQAPAMTRLKSSRAHEKTNTNSHTLRRRN